MADMELVQIVRKVFDLLGRRCINVIRALGHFEIVASVDDLGVQVGVLYKGFRNLLVLKNGFPWALRLTNTAIDALLGIDVELIRKGRIVTLELNDAVHRANLHTGHIDFVPAQARNYPRHLFLSLRSFQ